MQARSKGLIASPSRGVVTQALALGRPVYLFCPKGHLEQEYNLRFYMKRFAGVACPKSWRYRRFFGARCSGRNTHTHTRNTHTHTHTLHTQHTHTHTHTHTHRLSLSLSHTQVLVAPDADATPP